MTERFVTGLGVMGVVLAIVSSAPSRLVGQTAAPAAKAPVACADLTKLTFEGNTTITSATSVTGGTLALPGGRQPQTLTGLPAFCRVVGNSKPTSDSNINFEVWLPASGWNNKFVSAGEGGYAGAPNYTRNGLDGGLDELLRRGYATAGTDTGHTQADEAWAVGHPEKIIDYAYRSKHLVTVAAKGVIAAYYGRPAARAYYNSCSNGGRQGLMEAQRYPDDFDGIVAGAPWNFQSHSNAGFVWDAQAVSAPGAAIPAPKLAAINKAALAACDANDGLADGLIENPGKCAFDPGTMVCKGADSDTCLTEPQVAAVRKLYSGPKNPRTGASIYPGWAIGSELGWARAAAGSTITGLGKTYFAELVFQKPDWDFRAFDFDKDMATADAKVGALADSNDPNLTAAKRRGVKIIQYHGWNDQTLQPGNSPNYYERVTTAMGGPAQTEDFYRLFMVPGMTHCYFGAGASSFGGVGQQIPPARDARHDVQTALEQWVEKGVAPNELIATKYVDDKPETKAVKLTRVLCPYPSVARYKSGDPNSAASFTCVKP